jgi:hypothetical protein
MKKSLELFAAAVLSAFVLVLVLAGLDDRPRPSCDPPRSRATPAEPRSGHPTAAEALEREDPARPRSKDAPRRQ